MATSRRITLAPVRAINPENLRAILEFLAQMLPIILQLFIPRPIAPASQDSAALRKEFLSVLGKWFEESEMSPEEFMQITDYLMAFLEKYRDYVNPPAGDNHRAA